MERRPATEELGDVPREIERFDDVLKGKAVEGQLYAVACPFCKKSISFIGNDVPIKCPHCGSLYIFKPRDERRLFILQDRYYQSGRSQDVLGEMYVEMQRYAGNMAKHQAKKTRSFSKSYIDEISSEAAVRLVESYLKHPDYRVKVSFGMILSKKVVSIMHDTEQQKMDATISLDQPIFSGGSRIADSLARLHLGAIDQLYEQSSRISDENARTRREFIRMLDQIYLKIRQDQGMKASLLFLCAIRLQLFARRPISAIDRFYEVFGSKTRSNMEKAELLLREMTRQGALA